MAVHPEGETRRDRRRQWYLGIITVIALLSLCCNVVLTARSIQMNDRNHASTTRLNNEIIAKDKQIIVLLKEHSTTFAQQSAAAKAQALYDGDVLAFAQNLQAELAALCSVTHATCPPLPQIP